MFLWDGDNLIQYDFLEKLHYLCLLYVYQYFFFLLGPRHYILAIGGLSDEHYSTKALVIIHYCHM